MRIGITGSSGLIGRALVARLRANGDAVVPFVRRAAGAGEIRWDPVHGALLPTDLADLDAVVHLAGAGIGDHRWTDDYKRTVRESRVAGTELLATAMASAAGAVDGAPTVLLSGSAVGVYGDMGDDAEPADEQAPAGTGFLAELCRDWEAATTPAAEAGIRVAHLRTGIVLSRTGGALGKMLPLFKLGVGGRFGNGRQWMSWISIDDQLGAIEHLIRGTLSGPVNLTAPNPVRNAEFAATIGRVLHRPAVLPVPPFGPKLLLGGERAEALLFDGQRVVPGALLADGYRFQHADLEPALRSVLAR